MCEAESDMSAAMEAYQAAADYYQGEESTSAANQCLLKVAGFAAASADYKRAIEIYEQVAAPTPACSPRPDNRIRPSP